MKSDTKNSNLEFSKIRSIFWPIYSNELKKFLPMAIMMLCVVYNYSMLRALKDTLVITSMQADVIPTLKLWYVLPSAVLFMLVYSKLMNAFSKDSVFYIITSIFLLYFFLFNVILIPNHESLLIDFSGIESEVLRNLLKPIGCWTYSSFYVMSELWGSAMISLMFWKFANDVTSIPESKRFYAMFGFIANVALILSGIINKGESKTSASGEWEALPVRVYSVIMVCLFLMAIYWWLTTKILPLPEFQNKEVKPKKKKEKLSLGESFKYILSSKYLGYIALLIICYGISMNLVEVVWKNQVNAYCHGSKAEYSQFMGDLQIWTGLATVICMIIGNNILRMFSWFTSAMITPMMMIVTGIGFFAFMVFQNQLTPTLSSFGVTAIGCSVFLGLAQNVLSKSTKYSLFDTTKEMSYIPLDDELKSKGKAAVDVIGGRLGKSGGASIMYILLNIGFLGGTIVSVTNYVAVAFLVIMGLWVFAVYGLNSQFMAITTSGGEKKEEKAD